MFDLTGKIALVTGGGRGIGRALSIGLAQAGAYVIVDYLDNRDAAADTVRVIRQNGGQAECYQASVAEEADMDALYAHIEETLGRLDILVNNAAILSRFSFLEMPTAEWKRIMNGNVNGYFLCGQRAARMMVRAGKGRIINISSVSQIQAAPNRAHYCTSKAAIGMLTRCMALELAPYGVTVNAVLPGSIHTDFNDDVLSDPIYAQNAVAKIPAGRIGKAEDVVAAVLMLASDEAGYSSGAMVTVDGAMTVY